MYDVFISYVTPNLEKADGINDHLKSEGYNTFFDRNSMYGGGDFYTAKGVCENIAKLACLKDVTAVACSNNP